MSEERRRKMLEEWGQRFDCGDRVFHPNIGEGTIIGYCAIVGDIDYFIGFDLLQGGEVMKDGQRVSFKQDDLIEAYTEPHFGSMI